jgi:hypothetical protein
MTGREMKQGLHTCLGNSLRVTVVLALCAVMEGCNGWLTEPSPGTTSRVDYFASGITAVYVTNAAYVPMVWELNSPGVYYNEFLIGDIVSDDALKGGQNFGDMPYVYDLENFRTIANNELLLDFFRTQYQGVSRCNLAIEEVQRIAVDEELTEELRSRLIGEAKFLRALYYFRLVRVFGGVPLIREVIESSERWSEPRASIEDTYAFIVEDLTEAEWRLWTKDRYAVPDDVGRATKGAAQAMLLKANLYRHNYEEAARWGAAIYNSGEYRLVENYADNFTVAGENGLESVFEIQYVSDPNSDYGPIATEGGNGYTRGTFATKMMRSRSSKLGAGWGINKPTQNLYNAFEWGDPRRDVAIFNPTDEQIENPTEEIYFGSRYLNGKYAMYIGEDFDRTLSHDSRGELNYKLIRYADVLLMYAEALVETGDLGTAQRVLNEVRSRARGGNPDILPDFPYGDYAFTQEDMRTAVRRERRVELAMEGHRWFDLCRWGIAAETMNIYRANEIAEIQEQMSPFEAGKHELFPIPSKEIDLNPAMGQNEGY